MLRRTKERLIRGGLRVLYRVVAPVAASKESSDVTVLYDREVTHMHAENCIIPWHVFLNRRCAQIETSEIHHHASIAWLLLDPKRNNELVAECWVHPYTELDGVKTPNLLLVLIRADESAW